MQKQYNPYQRRVAAGNRDGGRWDSDGISNEGPSQRAIQRVRTKPLVPIKKPRLNGLIKPPKFETRRQAETREREAAIQRIIAGDKPLGRVYGIDAILSIGALGRVMLPYAVR